MREGAGSDSNNQPYPAEHQGHQGREEKMVMTNINYTAGAGPGGVDGVAGHHPFRNGLCRK